MHAVDAVPLTPPAPAPTPGSSWLLSSVALLWLGIYLLLPSRQFLYDAVEYSAAVRDGVGLVHPHHLLYGPLGRALLGFIEDPLGVLRGLQIVNAAAVAGTLWLTGLSLERLRVSRRLAALSVLILGATSGALFVATNVEVYPLAMLPQSGAVLILLSHDDGPLSTGRALAAATLVALGALFHQTGIFAGAGLCFVVYRRAGCRGALLFAAAASAGFWTAYLLAARGLGIASLRATVAWMFSYVDTAPYRAGVWGGGLSVAGLLSLPFGLARTLYNPRLIDVLETASVAKLRVLDGLSLACFALALGSLVAAGRELRRAQRLRPPALQRPAGRTALWIWLCLHAAFTMWWEPGNPEFWLLLLPPATVLIGSYLVGIDARGKPGRGEVRLLAAALLLFFAGGFGRVFPSTRYDDNLTWQLMQLLAQQPPAQRLRAVVATQHAELRPYTRLFFGQKGALETISLTEVAYETATEKATALAAYREKLGRLASERPLYILDDEARCPPGPVPELQRFQPADCESAYRELLSTAQLLGEVREAAGTVRVYRAAARR